MVHVSGPLRVVTDRPLLVSQVRVRAARDRAERGGLTAAFSDTVTVEGGQLTMDVLPGPAVLDVAVTGGHSHVVRLVVPDTAEATLEQCVLAAEVAGEADKRTLERLAGEVVADRDEVRRLAGEAAGSASSASSSESAAAKSAKSAAALEAGAQGAQAAAAESAKSAATSEKNAGDHAATAAQHEVAASGSAKSARSDADRAATIAGSTRWVGTKVEVNGKMSPDLMPVITISSRGTWVVNGKDTGQAVRGADGKMTFEDLTPAQRESLKVKGDKGDKGDPGPQGEQGDRGEQGPPGTTTWAGITGKPSTFAPSSHTHTLAQISNAPNSHTSTQTASTLMSRDSWGRARVANPSYGYDIANKQYVDDSTSTTLANAKAYTDALIVEGNTSARDGKLHIVYE